jgi:hypothetical protein
VKPDDDFPLDREPRRDDRIFVRGQRYTFDEPVRFKKLDSLTGQDSIGYMQPGDETGFRVVLEPPAPDSTAATHR